MFSEDLILTLRPMGKKYVIYAFKQLLKRVLKSVTPTINLIWLVLEKKVYLFETQSTQTSP